jgi:hypothetical protein
VAIFSFVLTFSHSKASRDYQMSRILNQQQPLGMGDDEQVPSNSDAWLMHADNLFQPCLTFQGLWDSSCLAKQSLQIEKAMI